MTTLVDLRHWRIEADLVCLDQTAGDGALPSSHAPECAEIILFPRISRALLRRSRKSLKRRFAARPADPRA